MNFIGVLGDFHFDPFRSVVLRGIVESFLQHPEEGKADFKGQRTRYIASEVDLHLLPFTKLPAGSLVNGRRWRSTSEAMYLVLCPLKSAFPSSGCCRKLSTMPRSTAERNGSKWKSPRTPMKFISRSETQAVGSTWNQQNKVVVWVSQVCRND